MKINTHQNKLIVKMYNKISGENVLSINDIPSDRKAFLFLFSYDDLIKPFARELLLDGHSVRNVARLLNVNRQIIRTINANLYT